MTLALNEVFQPKMHRNLLLQEWQLTFSSLTHSLLHEIFYFHEKFCHGEKLEKESNRMSLERYTRNW